MNKNLQQLLLILAICRKKLKIIKVQIKMKNMNKIMKKKSLKFNCIITILLQ